jgi:hypothetical protein
MRRGEEACGRRNYEEPDSLETISGSEEVFK